jgi:hypothetical protein
MRLPDAAITLEVVLAEAQKNRRVCPQPQRWQELYEMLPGKRRTDSGWEPPLPLILSGWWATPALAKILCVRSQLEWAEVHGVLAWVYDFLRSLPEDEWHHLGE